MGGYFVFEAVGELELGEEVGESEGEADVVVGEELYAGEIAVGDVLEVIAFVVVAADAL